MNKAYLNRKSNQDIVSARPLRPYIFSLNSQENNYFIQYNHKILILSKIAFSENIYT